MVGFAGDVLHVCPVRIDTVAVEVLPKRTIELVRVVFHHRSQLDQLFPSPLRRSGSAALEVLAVTGNEGTEIETAHRMVLNRVCIALSAVLHVRACPHHSLRNLGSQPRCSPTIATFS